MRRQVIAILLALAGMAGMTVKAAPSDDRTLVKLPEPMQQHMLGNMRDHLRVLHEIQVALAQNKFNEAADVAENRLGMSSLAAHGAEHMAPYMPKEMQAIGTEMHRAASRFARNAIEGDTARSLRDLSKVTEQCVACHTAYRIR